MFALAFESVKTRFAGLLGEVLWRGVPCDCTPRRIAGRLILALGGYGMASGDGEGTVGTKKRLPEPERCEGERGDGEKGALCVAGERDLVVPNGN